MEAHQHSPDSHTPQAAGAASLSQSVVELLSVSACGLTFWSRHGFDIAAELQLRLDREAFPFPTLPAPLRLSDGWVMVRGFVVDCNPARRADGTVGFEITLIFEPVMRSKARASAREWPARLSLIDLN